MTTLREGEDLTRGADGEAARATSARRALVEAVRELNEVVATTAVPDEVLARRAATVRALSDGLRSQRLPQSPRTTFADAVGATEYGWQRDNPAVPGLRITFDDGRARCELAGLGLGYEGPDGLVHGGVLAMVLDAVLSSLVQHHGLRSVTASLSVDFRAPTPLHTPLVVEAELEEIEGRKVSVTGRVRCEDGVSVEALGLFLQVGAPVE